MGDGHWGFPEGVVFKPDLRMRRNWDVKSRDEHVCGIKVIPGFGPKLLGGGGDVQGGGHGGSVWAQMCRSCFRWKWQEGSCG